MGEKTDLLGYCGLYCGDCAGYSGEIAEMAGKLKETLKKWRFDRTAKCLFSEKLKDYDKLWEMLCFMADLRCKKTCRERKDSDTSCRIRKCCRDSGLYGCYECDEFETCDKLKSLEELHGDSCAKNMKAIKEMGLEAWISRGKRLWFGSEVDND